MPVKTSQPSGDITTNWPFIVPSSPSTHYDKVDESIAAKNTSDYIEARSAGFIDEFGFPVDSPANMDEVTSITMAIHLDGAPSLLNPGLEVSLWSGGIQHGSSLEFDVSTPAFKVALYEFNGLSMTKAQYDQRQVRLLSTASPAGGPPPFET